MSGTFASYVAAKRQQQGSDTSEWEEVAHSPPAPGNPSLSRPKGFKDLRLTKKSKEAPPKRIPEDESQACKAEKPASPVAAAAISKKKHEAAPATLGVAGISVQQRTCMLAVAEAAANLAEIALRATQGDPGMNAIAEDAAKLAIQVAGAVPSRKPDTVQPFRPGTGASIPAQRTGTPKFRGYSPLIHIVQGAPPSTASRPSTNPITHALQGDALAEAARESLSRGLSRALASRAGSAASQSAKRIPVTPQQGCQVLNTETAEGQPVELDRNSMEYMSKLLKHADKLKWTGCSRQPSPASTEIIQLDTQNMAFNAAVSSLGDRFRTHGQKSFKERFESSDKASSGHLDTATFKRLLASINIGQCLTEQVVQRLTEQFTVGQGDKAGLVNYKLFVEAVRYDRIEKVGLNGKLRHREGPDTHIPFGDSNLHPPFAQVSDTKKAEDALLHRYDAIYGGLLDVFEDFDINKDGNISWKEFGQIIRAFDSKYTLHLTDKEIVTLFREADLDHSGSINFKEFCNSFADQSAQRFLPEFMKPKAHRRSQVGTAWEWRPEVWQPARAHEMQQETEQLTAESVVG